MSLTKRLLLAAAVLGLWSVAVRADDEKKDATKDEVPVVKEIKVEGLRGARGPIKKPTVIKNAADLAKAFPAKGTQEAIKKQVDLEKQDLVFFSWSGSGQDKVSASQKKGKDAPEIVFEYKAGLTRDLRPHARLFAIRKGVAFELVRGGR